MPHGKSFDIDPSLPGVFKPLDTIRRKHQIEIKGSVLELDEILPALNLRMLRIGEIEAQLSESDNDRGSVGAAGNWTTPHRRSSCQGHAWIAWRSRPACGSRSSDAQSSGLELSSRTPGRRHDQVL